MPPPDAADLVGHVGPVGRTDDADEVDYVLVGHITKDLVPTSVSPRGYLVGGTVTYAGLTASRLGRRVGVVTSAGPDLDVAAALPGVALVVVPADATTTFENVYPSESVCPGGNAHRGRSVHPGERHPTGGPRQAGQHRRQYLRAVAAPIRPEHVPAAWRRAPIVHLAPLAQELSPDLLAAVAPAGLRGLTPQGWLRRWDASGLVGRADPAVLDDVLSRVDVVVLSEEDVGGDWATLGRYAARAPTLIVTRGAAGATLCRGDRRQEFPAFPAVEVDPTGAGDVFAAAYLVRLSETGDPAEATVFANCVASFAVEGPGTAALPDRARVVARREVAALVPWSSGGPPLIPSPSPVERREEAER